MNNQMSLAALLKGMAACLQQQVLPDVQEEFARGQMTGVIHLLGALAERTCWDSALAVEQLDSQSQAQAALEKVARDAGVPDTLIPRPPQKAPIEWGANPVAARIAHDESVAALAQWLQDESACIPPSAAAALECWLLDYAQAQLKPENRLAFRSRMAEMTGGPSDATSGESR